MGKTDNITQQEQPAPLTAEEQGLSEIYAELGVDDFEAALSTIRALKSSAAAKSEELSTGKSFTDASVIDTAGLQANDARKMLEKFRAFSSRIDSLNGTIASMEDQLRHLYADRERLEKEIGASEVDDVIATFSGLYMVIMNLEGQLATLYADREYLESELGKSDPLELVAMFKNVSQMVNGAHRELVAAGTLR